MRCAQKSLLFKTWAGTFYDPVKHGLVSALLTVEVRTWLAVRSVWCYIEEEGIVGDPESLRDLRGLPAIDLENDYLLISIFVHNVIVYPIKLGHELVAVLALGRKEIQDYVPPTCTLLHQGIIGCQRFRLCILPPILR